MLQRQVPSCVYRGLKKNLWQFLTSLHTGFCVCPHKPQLHVLPPTEALCLNKPLSHSTEPTEFNSGDHEHEMGRLLELGRLSSRYIGFPWASLNTGLECLLWALL